MAARIETMIAALPELGTLNRRKIAALVGVAPRCKDSGKKSGARGIKGGRASVRSALSMATFNAIKWNPTFKVFFDRSRANGKKFKVAWGATMRKMSAMLKVMIKTNTTWKQERRQKENV
jgi:transposase